MDFFPTHIYRKETCLPKGLREDFWKVNWICSAGCLEIVYAVDCANAQRWRCFPVFSIIIWKRCLFFCEVMGQAQSGTDKEVTLQNIQELYRKFASECPSGNLHLHEFKKIFGITSNSTEEESAYMENVFRSFDTNRVNQDFLWIPWKLSCNISEKVHSYQEVTFTVLL